MTRNEIADLLGYHRKFIHKAFDTCGCESIKKKSSTSVCFVKVVDYTLEEALTALSTIPTFTPMMREYLIENYYHDESGYRDMRKKKLKLPADISSFIHFYINSRSNVSVCVTCAYMIARKIDKIGCGYRPYCNLYSTFLYNKKPKVNVYKDRCSSYCRSNKSPFIFLPGKMPQKLTLKDKLETSTLGIDNSLFKSKRKEGEPIVILTDAFGIQKL